MKNILLKTLKLTVYFLQICNEFFGKLVLKSQGVVYGQNFSHGFNLLDISQKMLVTPNRITIGNNVFIGKNFYCNAFNNVIIQDNVMISHNVGVVSANHAVSALNHKVQRDAYELSQPITIGEGSWIGCNVVILPGVNIGKDAIIGAGSVVTKNVPDRSTCVGNPGKVIK